MKKTVFMFLILIAIFQVFPNISHAQTPTEERAVLESQLAQLEQEIAQKQADLDAQKGQSATLSAEITALKKKIDTTKSLISATNQKIIKLASQISDKNQQIQDLTSKLDHELESLSQLLKNTSQLDKSTFADLLLSTDSVSTFYSDITTYSSIKESVKKSVDQIRGVKVQTETVKNELVVSKTAQEDAKQKLIEDQKIKEAAEAYQKKLLSLSKDKENQYQQILNDQKARAAQIRSALFQLAGGGVAIPFGDAYKYALQVQDKIGIRPAFLLAIIQQESSFGIDNGSCYINDINTGSGIGSKSGRSINKVMYPSDIPIFISLMYNLGRDPYKTLVSCPQSSGWGGAMGPAQMLASTWNRLQSRISNLLSISTPDPWRPLDAFLASGLYLYDAGARGGSYTSEINAACQYFSGRSCSRSRAGNSYGKSVMARASKIQSTMIDPLQGV